jgi:hypothetical protein
VNETAPAGASIDPKHAPPSKLGKRVIIVMLVSVLLYGVLVAVRGTKKIEQELASYAW